MPASLFSLWMLVLAGIWLRPMDPTVPPTEICNNALDDDADGLIDLNDPDCQCAPPEPVSLIPNPSFELFDCCPSGNAQLDCAQTWIQASAATTDYYHRCGYFEREQFPVPMPIPDGDAYIGFRNGRFGENPNPNWKEYTGACLLSPLKAGTTYIFEFHIGFVSSVVSPPMNVVLYGTTDCVNLPFGMEDSAFGCPTNDPNWQRLGQVAIGGFKNWKKYRIRTTPREDMLAMAIGPDCIEASLDTNPYYFLDNLVLADQELFGPTISTTGHPCSRDFTLTASEKPGAAYQWYRNGIAVVGATGRDLHPGDAEGSYQVMTTSGGNCIVSAAYPYTQPRSSHNSRITVCPNGAYFFGDRLLTESGSYEYTFQDALDCDSTVQLNLTVLPDMVDTLETYLFKGETFRIGRYIFNQAVVTDVTLTSSLGCDSLVHLVLREYQVYIPSAFSPNEDGVNDYFQVYGSDAFIQIQALRIYDRWGTEVYRQTDGETFQWDGRRAGEVLPNGIYIYALEVRLYDGSRKILSGDLAILR